MSNYQAGIEDGRRAGLKEAMDIVAAQEFACRDAFARAVTAQGPQARACSYERGRADANGDTFDILKAAAEKAR